MLDALIAEARVRWGLDPADGLQVAALERLAAVPVDAWRPLVVVPAVALRSPVRTSPSSRSRDGTVTERPPPRRSSGASIRRITRWGSSVGRGRRPSAPSPTSTSPAPLYLGPLARRRRRRRPLGDAVDLAIASARPTAARGTASRPTRRSASTSSRRPTRSTTRSTPTPPRPALAEELGDLLLQVVLHAQLAAEAGVFDLTDVQAAIAAKIVRRHPHVFGDAEAQTAADVNRQWERIKADERAAAAALAAREAAAAGRTIRPRSRSRRAPSTASAGPCRRSQPARRCRTARRPSATTGRTIDGDRREGPRGARGAAGAATPAERARGVGRPAAWSPSTSPGGTAIEAEGALRAANEKFRRPLPARRARWPPSGASRCATYRLRQLDELWDAAKVEEAAARRRQAWRITHDDRERAARSAPTGAGPAELRPVAGRSASRSGPRARAASASADTDVLCAATIEDRVPPHLRGKGTGWVTAEYCMLPRATAERTAARGRQGPDRRPDARDPAARRPLAARRRGPRQARRADGHGRLRRPPGRRRDADARRSPAGTSRSPSALITFGMERQLGARSAAVSVGIVDGRPCSTSTTRRTRTRRWTSTSSARTPAPTSSCRARPRAAVRPGRRGRLLDLADTGLAQLFEAQAQAIATVESRASRPRRRIATASGSPLTARRTAPPCR